ncbi:MAG: hypothetical protein J0H49_20115 [Acidobacteria bacterium]|nr:hypothetical protein [Acidobacteriota bacterium]
MRKTPFHMMMLFAPAMLLIASDDGAVAVPAGIVLRSQLEDTVRARSGARIAARLSEPVYLGDKLVFRQGTVVKGAISSITPLPFAKRKRRLLVGDFTPPQVVQVTFDQIVLPDGKVMPVSTAASIGVADIHRAIYSPNRPRTSVKQALSDATRPLTESKKLQRLGRAAVRALPYHPEFLDRGVVFNSPLLAELKTMPITLTDADRSAGNNVLYTRLLTPLVSSSASADRPVKAAVLRPYYAPDGALLFPAGTTLDGTVSNASPSGNWKKHGALRFEFRSVSAPGREPAPLKASVVGVEASHPNALSVGEDGRITARNSRAGQLLAFASLVGPSMGAAAPGSNKTVFARAGQGQDLGLVGIGAAQTSSSTATGIGFSAAALRIYDRIFAHGAEIELPENTPLLLRILVGTGGKVDNFGGDLR